MVRLVELLGLLSIAACAAYERVLLRDVQSLTFHDRSYTIRRRGGPVPQLRCVGGDAHGSYTPEVVKCTNTRPGDNDVEWDCAAQMPSTYKLEEISIICEGFGYNGDPYILRGSCSLEYELQYRDSESGNLSLIIVGIALCVVIPLGIAVLICNRRSATNTYSPGTRASIADDHHNSLENTSPPSSHIATGLTIADHHRNTTSPSSHIATGSARVTII
ncbi:hypothetical protein QR680_000628 [Steinernema hermaphroditum]|uniref:Store-operated calcium entry-associated regulatory factor n=1 Tax=Steinernema hermaphroditum TaxID=289476 RepID=A0AA39LEE4_9BILA|nr:hypothetical protein QR680_000628 [Steinernema hermaphroditum]